MDEKSSSEQLSKLDVNDSIQVFDFYIYHIFMLHTRNNGMLVVLTERSGDDLDC